MPSFLQCKFKRLESFQLVQCLFRIDCHFPLTEFLHISMKWPSIPPIPTTYFETKGFSYVSANILTHTEKIDLIFSMREETDSKNPLS